MHSFRPTRRALTSHVALERSGHNGCWLAFGHSDREHHLLVMVSGTASLNGDVNLGDNLGTRSRSLASPSWTSRVCARYHRRRLVSLRHHHVR